MTGTDSIADSLPPPRDDESADLRRDIIDELNDHLDCAVQRELLRGKDEADARRSAIQRFGDIPTIARRLWWDAMKERIMRTRILWSLGTVAVVVVILFCAFVLMVQMELIRAMREEMKAAQTRVIAPPASLEWGSLTIELIDEHGGPMSNWQITVFGDMYHSGERISRKILTDADGRVILDPIRAANHYGITLNGRNGWHYYLGLNKTLFLEPGKHITHTIHQPKTPMVPVTFEFDLPAEWKDTKIQTGYVFKLIPNVPDRSKYWQATPWVLIGEGGRTVSLLSGNYANPNKKTSDGRIGLPVGTYILTEARLNRVDSLPKDIPAAFTRTSVTYPKGEFTFEVKLDGVNHIKIPLPPKMIDESVVNPYGGLPSNRAGYGGYGMETGENDVGAGGMSGDGGEAGYGGYGGSYGAQTQLETSTDQAEKTAPRSSPQPQ